MFWGLTFSIIIIILVTGCGIGVCYLVVSRFKKIEAKILISFLIFGLLIGGSSFWMGKTDFVAVVNFPGSEISEIVYNKWLIPYWERTLEPVGYEEIPIIELPPVTPPELPRPGEKVGAEIVPIYDFPLKKVSDLYIPITLLFWGIVGLKIQLIYNTGRRHRGLLR